MSTSKPPHLRVLPRPVAGWAAAPEGVGPEGVGPAAVGPEAVEGCRTLGAVRTLDPVRELAELAVREEDPMVLVRPTGPGDVLRAAWCNGAFSRLSGHELDELVGLRLPLLSREGADASDQPGWLPTVGEVMSELRCRDGSTLRVVVRVVSVGSAAAPAWMLRVRAAGDAVRADARLRASEDRFSALAEQAPVGIFASDVGLRLGYVNDRMAQLLGRPPEDCLGTDWLDVVHPEDLGPLVEALQGVLAGEPATVVLRGGRQHDVERRLELSVVPVTSVDRGASFVGTVQDVTERHAFESRLRQQALHDALTELPNRRLLLERTEESLRRVGAEPAPVALFFLDLDGFKLVNDSLGHVLGDELLRQVAARLAAAVRQQDLVARVGGDEFVVLCPDVADEAAALQVAVRLREALAGPIRLGSHEVSVGVSVGVALAQGAATAVDLLRDADVAMYQAKTAGKDRVALFDAAVRRRLADRLQLLSDLRRALHTDEIRVVYQPVVALEDGRVRSVETLARWQHPVRGAVSPDEFIPLAEESNLISTLGEFVLRQSCRQLAEWRRELGALAPDSVSVNLSAVQLRSPGLVELVTASLAEAGLSGSDLCLELTESVLMHDPGHVSRQLGALREIGVRIAMDDFGTGYSSLSYLQQLPVDRLKLDRSLLAGLTERGGRSLVPAAVVLAQGLDLEPVAEGVETPEQLARLRELGCATVQGFGICRPLPSTELSEWLRGRAAAPHPPTPHDPRSAS